MDGLETLSRIQELTFAERPEVVIISGHGTIETAVKATKLGAFDFLEKPLTIQKVTVILFIYDPDDSSDLSVGFSKGIAQQPM